MQLLVARRPEPDWEGRIDWDRLPTIDPNSYGYEYEYKG